MLEQLKKRKRLKLLMPTAALLTNIAITREANRHPPRKHLLHERLVFSFLAYRARKGMGASLRQVCRETTLHPTTAKDALHNLAGLVSKQDGKWMATEPPEGWFRHRKTDYTPEHWHDKLAYTMLWLPRQGARLVCDGKVRRFGLNHAATYSFLVSRAKKANGVLRQFTFAGQAAMLGVDPKTVKTVIGDLESVGLIRREDFGRCSDITLLPLTENHQALFEPAEKRKKRTAAKVPVPSKPKREAYILKGDGFDHWRQLCIGLMPQTYAEDAIRKARRLGDDYEGFEMQLAAAKAQHESNQLAGTVGPGNLGAYFTKRLQTRIEKLEQQERQQEAVDRQEAYVNSDEFRKKQAEESEAIAADPTHPSHIISFRSIVDRVCLPPNSWNEADKIRRHLESHCYRFYASCNLPFDRQDKEAKELSTRIIARALKSLNQYYKQPVLATAEEFKAAIDDVIRTTVKGMKPLFGKSEIVPEVAQ